MDPRQTGLFVALFGAVLVVTGLLIAAGLLGWFGRLPGDIRLGGEHVRVYVPLTSMLLTSLVLTLLAAVIRRLL